MAQEAMYIEIYKQLKDMILQGTYRSGDLLPTEYELTEQFYTSRITVRKAMTMLQKEGYIKRIPGRGTYVQDEYLASRRAGTKFVGVVLCNVGASFGLELLMSIERRCAELGYSIVFKNSLDDSQLESDAINELVSLGAVGMIIQPVHREYYNKHLIFHHFNKFPIVLVDRHFSGFTIPSVSTNNVVAASAMTEHLISLGHRNICFLSSDPKNTTTIEDRQSGFKSTCILHGIPITEASLIPDLTSPHLGGNQQAWNADIAHVRAHLAAHPELTCLFASEFTVAKLANLAVRALGKTLVEDISLAMFDASDGVADMELTHIEQDQPEIGRQAAEILHRIISGEVICDKLLIPHKLVPGNTVRRLRA